MTFDPLQSYRAIWADLFRDPFAPKRELTPSPLPQSDRGTRERDARESFVQFIAEHGDHFVDVPYNRVELEWIEGDFHGMDEGTHCRIYFVSKRARDRYFEREKDRRGV